MTRDPDSQCFASRLQPHEQPVSEPAQLLNNLWGFEGVPSAGAVWCTRSQATRGHGVGWRLDPAYATASAGVAAVQQGGPAVSTSPPPPPSSPRPPAEKRALHCIIVSYGEVYRVVHGADLHVSLALVARNLYDKNGLSDPCVNGMDEIARGQILSHSAIGNALETTLSFLQRHPGGVTPGPTSSSHVLRELRVAASSHWGQHRSVAFAESLAERLRFLVTHVTVCHLERQRWSTLPALQPPSWEATDMYTLRPVDMN